MYLYKQEKHNELMAKLQNSYGEHHMGGGLGQGRSFSHQHCYRPNRTAQGIGNNYNRLHECPFSTTKELSHARTTHFIMPKIRYRHIEDQRNKGKNDGNAYG
jgi:hypothetical protein